MKVLVCGSRDWTNKDALEREFKKLPPGTIIVHGACPTGADMLVDKLAMTHGFKIRRYPADWNDPALPNSRAAGPIRNARMLRAEHPDDDGVPFDFGLAFTLNLDRSRGTRDMVTRARRAGIRMEILAQ